MQVSWNRYLPPPPSPWKSVCSFNWTSLNPWCVEPSLVEIGHVFLKTIFSFIIFAYFAILSPWKKSRALCLKKHEFPSQCLYLGWEPRKLSELVFKLFVYVHIYTIKYVQTHHPSVLCAKCGWNWPGGSGNINNFRRRQRRRRTTNKILSKSPLEPSAQMS